MANCKMTVKSGGTLIVDGGRLLHADIEMESSSTLKIKNGGLLHMKPDDEQLHPLPYPSCGLGTHSQNWAGIRQ